MIVLLVAALAVVALLAAGGWIARSRARQRRARLDSARRAAAAAEARAEQERRRAAAEASDALTSVIPAIRLPWPTELPGAAAAQGDGYGAFRGDYPAFSALAPFRPEEEPGGGYPGDPQAGYPEQYADELAQAPDRVAGRGVPAPRPAERTARPAEHSTAADHQRRRAVQGSHRGGHAKRRRG